ncbi:MAG: SGNH/GDSL hydrolase family protein [Leptolyngbya sp.]|nr:SGNH/GDSL hydrolase family protein [Candidatus Melainabacteria bacterium]
MQSTEKPQNNNEEEPLDDGANVENGSCQTGSSKHHRSWWRPFVETVIASVLLIGWLETFFNFAGIGQQEFLEPDPVIGSRHIASKQVTWRLEGLSRDSLNAYGMRDFPRELKKPISTLRIAVLGDSAVEGLQVPLEETFPADLERMLNREFASGKGKFQKAEVLNFGCAGYSTAQELVQYETLVSKFAPDVVVLFYNHRDAQESVILETIKNVAEVKPYAYLDKEGQINIDNSVVTAHAEELKPSPVLDWLRRNSRIYGVINQTTFALNVNDKRFVKVKHWWTKAQKDFAPKNLEISNLGYGVQDADAVGGKLIEKLNSILKAKGSRLVLVMFPNLVPYKELTSQEEQFRKLSQREGFSHLDLTPAFKKYPRPQDLIIQYHFSKKGHQLIADSIAPLLAEQ